MPTVVIALDNVEQALCALIQRDDWGLPGDCLRLIFHREAVTNFEGSMIRLILSTGFQPRLLFSSKIEWRGHRDRDSRPMHIASCLRPLGNDLDPKRIRMLTNPDVEWFRHSNLSAEEIVLTNRTLIRQWITSLRVKETPFLTPDPIEMLSAITFYYNSVGGTSTAFDSFDAVLFHQFARRHLTNISRFSYRRDESDDFPDLIKQIGIDIRLNGIPCGGVLYVFDTMRPCFLMLERAIDLAKETNSHVVTQFTFTVAAERLELARFARGFQCTVQTWLSSAPVADEPVPYMILTHRSGAPVPRSWDPTALAEAAMNPMYVAARPETEYARVALGGGRVPMPLHRMSAVEGHRKLGIAAVRACAVLQTCY